jgi:hypothetical protein
MKHIIFYSGGICSWYTALRIIEREGKENVLLLFTDTKTEDKDLYRFIDETSLKFGVELLKIADGRDVWEVMKSHKFISNSKIAHCSEDLKQKIAKKYIKENFRPNECILYLGIDWTEMHRIEAPKRNWKPYKVEFPMTEEPYLSKDDMFNMLEKKGIKKPQLYEMGFSHNNCGGFCVRAGQGHFINLLKKMPERYKYHEEKEQEMINFIGKEQSILRKVVKGKKELLTLKKLREEYETKPENIDLFDIGGCGCFVNTNSKMKGESKNETRM